jgi:hypothetical protein
MPSRVSDWPTGRPSAYPFEEYADGGLYLWRKGSDYACQEHTFASAASRWAREHGYECATRVQKRFERKGKGPGERSVGIPEGVVVQFVAKTGAARADLTESGPTS